MKKKFGDDAILTRQQRYFELARNLWGKVGTDRQPRKLILGEHSDFDPNI